MTAENSDRGGRSGRWLRREARKRQERERLKKHGASLRRVYLDAVRKRAKQRAGSDGPSPGPRP
jgi:hypothetical protein